jgi:hypothetical protein
MAHIGDGDSGDGFVRLRVRSAYSLLEGAIKAADIAKLRCRRPCPRRR